MPRVRKTRITILLALVVFLPSLFFFTAPKLNGALPSSEDVLRVLGIGAAADSGEQIVFMDVGQGDGALILSDGHAALIDCGTAEDDGISLVQKLRQYGVTSVDYLFLSHPHSDHIGGSLAVLNNFSVGMVCCPEFAPADNGDSGLFERLIAQVQSQNVPISGYEPGSSFTVGNFSVEVLWCDLNADSENNRSAVLRVRSDSFSALFTGDMETQTEQDLLAASLDLKCDLLKIGHHGSKTSTSAAFLTAVNPDYAVISVGENTFGHPSDEVIQRLKNAGVTYYRTDVSGDIVFSIGDEIKVQCSY